MREKLLYEVRVPPEEQSRIGDVHEAYRVYELDPKYGGCLVEGLVRGEWIANVSARWLVKHLLELANLPAPA